MSRSKRLLLALRAVHGDEAVLKLTDNRRLLLSSRRKKDGSKEIRVHQMFLDGGEDVMHAVAHYMKEGDDASGKIIDAFVKAQMHLLALHAAPLKEGAAKGVVHDLLPIFHEVNQRYFGGQMDPEITWGSAGAFKGRTRRTITLGSYDGAAHRVTIHPALDHKRVPRVVLERVMHHELLHIKHPIREGPSGRRIIHSRAFRAEEALFADADEADRWVDDNLQFILKFRPRPSRSQKTGAKSSADGKDVKRSRSSSSKARR